ncbi:MAG: acyltransferase family protein, partial [Opitutaceae bacterium]
MKRLLALRFRPSGEAPGKPTRDIPLEGLRGLCALLVLYAHIFVPNAVLDPKWVPSSRFWWLNLGYPAVLLFFVLSGYVIGLVTQQPATPANLRHYLRRRAIRIFPMTMIA